MRRVTCLFFFGFLGLVSWLLAAAPPAVSRAPAPSKPNTLRIPPIRPGSELVDLLRKQIDWAGFPEADPKVLVSDVLERLGAKYHITFDVNEKAFRDEKCYDVLKSPIAEVPLPGITSNLSRVLRKVLDRVQLKSGATYLVRGDHIELTTQNYLVAEVWGKDYAGPYLPLVYLSADKKPLDEVVASLAEQGERNIAIDPRVGEKAQALVTIYLINKPLDSALFLVADQAGLAYAQIDNTYYLTSPDRVAMVKADWKVHRPEILAAKKSEAPAKVDAKGK